MSAFLPTWRPTWWPKWSTRTWVLAGVAWKVFATAVLLLLARHAKHGAVSVCGPVPADVASRYTDLVSYPLRTPDIAANVVVVRAATPGGGDAGWEVLLCNRSRPPPLLAIPGGYVEVGEDLPGAALRELHEETGLDVRTALGSAAIPAAMRIATPLDVSFAAATATAVDARLFSVNSAPDRDKRRHTVEVSYLVRLPAGSSLANQRPKGADDVKHCQYWALASIAAAEAAAVAQRGRSLFAFDHGRQVTDVHHSLARP